MEDEIKQEYRDAFDAIHRLSEECFGVAADNIGRVNIELGDPLREECGTVSFTRWLVTLGQTSLSITVNHYCSMDDEDVDPRQDKTKIAGSSMAHEYFHAVQLQFGDWVYPWSPIARLYESSAEHFGYIYLHSIGSIDYIDIRDDLYKNPQNPSSRIRTYQGYKPLRTHGGGLNADDNTVYKLGLLAVQYLIEQTDEQKLIEYFRKDDGIGGFGSESFDDIFGVSLDAFHTSFEAHRAAGFPIQGAPFITSDPPPTGESPTPMPTSTRTPPPTSSGEFFASISAGEYHTFGLRPDGAAVCWGRNAYGESTPPY